LFTKHGLVNIVNATFNATFNATAAFKLVELNAHKFMK